MRLSKRPATSAALTANEHKALLDTENVSDRLVRDRPPVALACNQRVNVARLNHPSPRDRLCVIARRRFSRRVGHFGGPLSCDELGRPERRSLVEREHRLDIVVDHRSGAVVSLYDLTLPADLALPRLLLDVEPRLTAVGVLQRFEQVVFGLEA